MPNWCKNNLKIKDNGEKVLEILEILKDEKGEFTMNKVVPMPIEQEKKELIETLLDVPSIFENDIDLNTNIEADNLGGMKEIIYNEIETTDPLLRITSRLPRYLYEFYSKNNKNAKDIPFSELPVQERYSNIRQANSISKNLKIIGCEMVLRDDETRKEYTILPV